MHQRTLGIDLGVKSTNVAVVWEEQEHRLIEVLRFELSLPEIKRVEEVALRGMAEGTKLHVVLEKTYPGCEYVSKYFLNQGHKVSYAKPDQVKEGRKFLWRNVKTDERDAIVMARLPYLDPDQLNRAYVPSALLRELKSLVSQRMSLVKQQTNLKVLLERTVNAVWPGLTGVLGSLDSDHARALIRQLQPERALKLGKGGLEAFIRENGRTVRAKKLAGQLVGLAQRAAELQSILKDDTWVRLQISHSVELLEQIEGLEQTLDSKDKQIVTAYEKADPNQYFKSIPGVGDRTAPTFYSYFGEPERFPTTRNAQGFVGFYPATDSSGQTDRKGTALSKEGPSLLRRDLFLSADQLRRQDPQGAKLYYDQMVNKGKHHTSAVCVVANRVLIPRLMAVAREQRPYEFRDLQANPITQKQAREIAAQFRVPEEVRVRLRNLKKKKNREGVSSPVTSELEAPRSESPSRHEDPTKDRVSVTKTQLAMLVYQHMEKLLNSGENLEEIRLQLVNEKTKYFEKRA
jgi:transposase